MIPGKLIPTNKACYVPYDGKEFKVDQCEVLLNDNYTWVKSSGGVFLDNALIGGSTKNGEELFVGRAIHKGYSLPGKIHPSHKCIYVSFNGAEIAYKNYEILVKEENGECS